MFSHYHLTHMEESIENIYCQMDLKEPHQITIDYISRKLNIWVYFRPFRSRALEKTPGVYTMVIDNRKPPYDQRIEFLHELGHLLRHSGNQTLLPREFTKAQEDDAEQFMMYAAMPYSMISRLKMPSLRSEAVNYIAGVFNVPISLAAKRFDQIQRRAFDGHLMSSLKNQKLQHLLNPQYVKPPDNQNPECTIYAYYDPSGEYESPSQLIIKINSQKYFSDERIPIDLSERFERIESDDDASLTGIPVLPTDMRIIDGVPNLMLPAVAFRHGRAARRFIVQMKDIESLMYFEQNF
ncbi:ImmA/IrrE family metallo-endopeptidase [Paenibacillus vini]|uniref:ImmA/IrrE family metallo-endopeptidase n=1 Tax=Paenibacillus vini TaxID=1476024 RepID=UPI0025B71B74|nr:ImmA/IrrE family metallo-endopeptidase [Paenibacillus vini]MDN4069232.1 ImmA/IrrE family metallo-endopeptidase [Paenibacillus vini]MDN4069285.1 ImmA/IrrE family metallo-endopeptidase [Paenibacillus vini]